MSISCHRFTMPCARLFPSCCLEQEPSASLGFVDPDFEQTGRRDVIVLVAKCMGLPHVGGELPVVVAELGKHCRRRDELGVVVEQPLQPADMADRPQRRTADLAHALGDGVGRGEDLVALLVEQQVIIAEVRTGHVPVEVLCLHVEGKYVGQQRREGLRKVLRGVRSEISRRNERGNAPSLCNRAVHDLISFQSALARGPL
jgi:hypothetical protein